MKKQEMTPARYMFPRPTLLVGSNIQGKANFMTVGGGGVANAEPPMIGVPIRHHQYTLKGILENNTFSINTPPASLVKETDYCGVISGRKTDKALDCGFTVYYGKLGTAPLIEECPLNHECKVVHILNLGTHAFVIGEVVGTYIDEDCLVDGKPDAARINPMIFNLEGGEYLTFGDKVGKAFQAGLELKEKTQ